MFEAMLIMKKKKNKTTQKVFRVYELCAFAWLNLNATMNHLAGVKANEPVYKVELISQNHMY